MNGLKAFGITLCSITFLTIAFGNVGRASEKIPSRFIYQSLINGTGEKATPDSSVLIHYRGTLADGKEFDSSAKRAQPAAFSLNKVIPCWTQGISKMRVGGKAKLTCPPELAYGANGAGTAIPPNATLSYEIELVRILH